MPENHAREPSDLPDYSMSIPAQVPPEQPTEWWFNRGETRWIDFFDGDLPCLVSVRLGLAPSGRPCFTGLRIGGNGTEEQEINSKTLRSINLGNIMAKIREVAASDEPLWTTPRAPYGKSLAEDLWAAAEPTALAVHRGPKGDPEIARRTLDHYEAALASGLRRGEAVARVSVEMDVSLSQVYRRLAKARRQTGGPDR